MSAAAEYFAILRDWKRLPAYKVETRVDSIVGFALPQVLSHARDLEVVAVIPELPLRIGSVQPQHEGKQLANRSYKVDFFVVTECGKNLLIEFKTDSGSRREGQDEYLLDAQAVGLRAVVSGIITLYSKTTYKEKYRHLLSKLKQAGLVAGNDPSFEPLVLDEKLEILYIQPHRKESDEPSQVIDFIAVASALEANFAGDEFMCEAARSFRTWTMD